MSAPEGPELRDLEDAIVSAIHALNEPLTLKEARVARDLLVRDLMIFKRGRAALAGERTPEPEYTDEELIAIALHSMPKTPFASIRSSGVVPVVPQSDPEWMKAACARLEGMGWVVVSRHEWDSLTPRVLAAADALGIKRQGAPAPTAAPFVEQGPDGRPLRTAATTRQDAAPVVPLSVSEAARTIESRMWLTPLESSERVWLESVIARVQTDEVARLIEALQEAEAGLEFAVSKLTNDWQDSAERVALRIVRGALAASGAPTEADDDAAL